MARDQKIESGDLELNKYTVTVDPASHDMGISLHYMLISKMWAVFTINFTAYVFLFWDTSDFRAPHY